VELVAQVKFAGSVTMLGFSPFCWMLNCSSSGTASGGSTNPG
jgi:hypothetical protein